MWGNEMMTEATSFMVCTGVQQYLLMAGHLLLLLTAPWTIYVSLDFCAHVFKLKTNYLPHSLALKACLCYSEMHEKRALRQASNNGANKLVKLHWNSSATNVCFRDYKRTMTKCAENVYWELWLPANYAQNISNLFVWNVHVAFLVCVRFWIEAQFVGKISNCSLC